MRERDEEGQRKIPVLGLWDRLRLTSFLFILAHGHVIEMKAA